MGKTVEISLTVISILTSARCFDDNAARILPVSPKHTSKAYRILPNTTKHLEILKTIQELSAGSNLVWKDTFAMGHPTDVIAVHEDQAFFERLLRKYNLAYMISADNVERLIEEEAEQNEWSARRMSDQSSRSADRLVFDVNRYHSYDDMIRFMEHLKWQYYYMVDIIDLGTTFEGRKIKTIKIGFPINDPKKRGIWIDAGIHAREWVSHSTAMYFVNLLTTQYNINSEIQQYVNNFTWYITPVLNPDGYEYSRSIKSVNVRFWRKNRATGPEFCTTYRCCVGVDLNRNYDFYWNDLRSVRNPCAEDFRGPYAFSENETKAVRDFMYLNSHKIDAFITLHTYSQYWIYPYGHRAMVYPRDISELKDVAQKAVKALKQKHGTNYEIGSGADLLYAASGGSEDWIKAHMKIKFAYLLELRPKESVWGGFSMHPRYLRPIGEETWEGVKVVADAVRKYNENLRRN